MIAFWIAVVVGVVVAAVYLALGVLAFIRVRHDILAESSTATVDSVEATPEAPDAGTFTWKSIGAVIASTSVIALLGVSPVFWYIPAVLAIGSAVAVIAAFVIDRRAGA